MSQDVDEKFLFSGFANSQILWDFEKQLWKIETYK